MSGFQRRSAIRTPTVSSENSQGQEYYVVLRDGAAKELERYNPRHVLSSPNTPRGQAHRLGKISPSQRNVQKLADR